MSHIFISYAHSDNDFVELMRIKLHETGIQTWVDHSSLQAGTDWRVSIDNAIRRSIAVILVMSPDSLGSHYVTYEWSFAHGLGKSIIPVMYREAPLHTKLLTLQYLDFTHRTLRPWHELIQRISALDS
jgi:TIR domain